MNSSFQPVTGMQTWKIRYTAVGHHRFVFDYAAFPLFFLFKHGRVWLLRSRLLQRLVHETAF